VETINNVEMKIKFVLESQRVTGKFRIELEATSLAELRDMLKLFEYLSAEEFKDEYIKELSSATQNIIKMWMESGLKERRD
jgi:hypothetical protein